MTLNFHLLFTPENARFSLREQSISWTFQNDQKTMSLIPDNSYVLSGYKVEMKIVENDGPETGGHSRGGFSVSQTMYCIRRWKVNFQA